MGSGKQTRRQGPVALALDRPGPEVFGWVSPDVTHFTKYLVQGTTIMNDGSPERGDLASSNLYLFSFHEFGSKVTANLDQGLQQVEIQGYNKYRSEVTRSLHQKSQAWIEDHYKSDSETIMILDTKVRVPVVSGSMGWKLSQRRLES